MATGPVWPLVVSVHGPSGKPLAGASVEVWVAARGVHIWNQRQGDGMREDVAAGDTGADGTFRCSLDALRERSLLFRCTRFVFVAVALPGANYSEHVLALPRTTEPRTFGQDVELALAAGIVPSVPTCLRQPTPRSLR